MTIYTTPTCDRCKVLKTKMTAKGIKFIEIQDAEVMKQKGINFVPILEVDDKLLEFGEANSFINSL